MSKVQLYGGHFDLAKSVTGIRGLMNFFVIFMFFALWVNLLALLNYRFGAKIWLFLLGFFILSYVPTVLPLPKGFKTIFQLLTPNTWINLFGPSPLHYLVDGLRSLFLLVLLFTQKSKLVPLEKQ